MIEKLIALAKQAGFSGVRTVWLDVKTSRQTLHNRTYDELARFAEQVRDEERKECAEHYLKIMRDAVKTAIVDEREACARIADTAIDPRPASDPERYREGVKTASQLTAHAIAKAIRERRLK